MVRRSSLFLLSLVDDEDEEPYEEPVPPKERVPADNPTDLDSEVSRLWDI